MSSVNAGKIEVDSPRASLAGKAATGGLGKSLFSLFSLLMRLLNIPLVNQGSIDFMLPIEDRELYVLVFECLGA